MRQEVEHREDLVRDSHSKALLSRDVRGLRAYKENYARKQEQKTKLHTLEQKVENLEDKLNMILDLLQEKNPNV